MILNIAFLSVTGTAGLEKSSNVLGHFVSHISFLEFSNKFSKHWTHFVEPIFIQSVYPGDAILSQFKTYVT